MAKGIVDAFKAVQIKIDEANTFMGACSVGYQTLGNFDTALAVCKASQRIKVGESLDMLRRCGALARVLSHNEDIASVAAAEPQLRGKLGRLWAAISVL